LVRTSKESPLLKLPVDAVPELTALVDVV
jgi:hypothetical protein